MQSNATQGTATWSNAKQRKAMHKATQSRTIASKGEAKQSKARQSQSKQAPERKVKQAEEGEQHNNAKQGHHHTDWRSRRNTAQDCKRKQGTDHENGGKQCKAKHFQAEQRIALRGTFKRSFSREVDHQDSKAKPGPRLLPGPRAVVAVGGGCCQVNMEGMACCIFRKNICPGNWFLDPIIGKQPVFTNLIF